MGLEASFDYIDSLNPDWPLGTDPKSEGDNHIAGIKKSLQGSVVGDGSYTALKIGVAEGLRVVANTLSLIAASDLEDQQLLLRNAANDLTLASLIAAAAGGLTLRNGQAGGGLSLVGRNAADDADLEMMTLAPEGGAVLNYAGDAVFAANEFGAEVRPGAGDNPVLNFKDASGATDYARIEFSVSENLLSVRTDTDNAPIQLRSQVAGAPIVLGDFNPAAGFSLRYENAEFLTTPANNVLRMISGSGVTSGKFEFRSGTLVDWGSLDATATQVSLRSSSDVAVYKNDNEYLLRSDADQGYLYGEGASWKIRADTEANRQLLNSSGSVRDGANAAQPIGFNRMPVTAFNASRDINSSDIGALIRVSGGGGTLTLVTTTNGATSNVVNANASTAVTIAAEAGSGLAWSNGAATVTGARTLAPGGICTVYQRTSTQFMIWGAGLS